MIHSSHRETPNYLLKDLNHQIYPQFIIAMFVMEYFWVKRHSAFLTYRLILVKNVNKLTEHLSTSIFPRNVTDQHNFSRVRIVDFVSSLFIILKLMWGASMYILLNSSDWTWFYIQRLGIKTRKYLELGSPMVTIEMLVKSLLAIKCSFTFYALVFAEYGRE